MRRTFLLGALGLLLAVSVTACGSSDSGSSLSIAKSTAVNAACKEEPVSGGSLVYSRQLETVSLNPRDPINGNGDIFADEMLYNGLVRNAPDGSAKIVPGLAKSWTVSPDGEVYTFQLRTGLKFSDGSPVTAEDVAWNLEQFRDPKVNATVAALAVGMESADAVGPTTVRIKLEHPIAAFLDDIAVFPAFVVSKEKLEAEGSAFWKHPVGTGPFRLKEFAGGSHITFERNPYFYEKGKPYLDSMRWNFVSDANTRVLSLKSGEAQIGDAIPFDQVESLQADPDLVVQLANLPQEVLLVTNTKIPALSDVHARRAMSYALNRELINKVVFKGVGTVPNSVLQNFELDATDKEVGPFEYNPTKAKAELAESTTPQGFSVTLQYPSGLDYFKQMALLIQQQLGQVGIQVKLIELEAATIAERWLSGEFEATFPFSAASSDISVPDEFATFYGIPSSGLDGFKSFWRDPRVEGQVERFLASRDGGARKREWRTIQEAIDDQMPSLNVLDYPLVLAHQSNVCGTSVNGLGVDQLQETWIAGKP